MKATEAKAVCVTSCCAPASAAPCAAALRRHPQVHPRPIWHLRKRDLCSECEWSLRVAHRYARAATYLLRPPCAQTSWVRQVMQIAAEDNGLDFDHDFLLLPNVSSRPLDEYCFLNATEVQCPGGPVEAINGWLTGSEFCLPCALLSDNQTLAAHLLQHPNTTHNAVLFHSAYLSAPLPTDLRSYILLYNVTAGAFPFFENDFLLEWKRALDQAIARLKQARRLSAHRPAVH